MVACGHSSKTSKPTVTAKAPSLFEPISAPETLIVKMPGLEEGNRIPLENVFGGMGCTGANHAPAVDWSSSPQDILMKAKSFALIMHDPDAPTGVGFFHWIVLNIPGNVTQLPPDSVTGLPPGVVQGYTDFGSSTYGGPCPPPGSTHRYVVTVYALDTPKLELDASATGALARFNVRNHTLALGRATGLYGRRNP